jgi:hypothetical protein
VVVRVSGVPVPVPVPVRAIVCGLVGSESAMLIVAVLVPVAVGLKVTWIKQLPPAARDEPQVFVCE